MMFGRGLGRGFMGYGGCFGNGLFSNNIPGIGIWHMIFTAVAVVLVGLILLAIIKKNHSHKDDDIVEGLKLKYVNGELSEEEYIRKKEILKRK